MDNSLPLQGKRIVVTRSQRQSAEFCDRLSQLGASPIQFPVIDFVGLPVAPLHNALNGQRYDWLIFTSVNAVEFYFAADPPAFAPAKVAAVGEATQAALQAKGISADFVPQTFSGAALANDLPGAADSRILLPRAQSGRPELTDQLRANGATVDDIALYKTVRSTVSAEQLNTVRRADAVTFTSPSSVRNFMALVPSEFRPPNAVIACIGPTTADEAQAFGLKVAVVPPRYTISDLTASLIDYWQRP